MAYLKCLKVKNRMRKYSSFDDMVSKCNITTHLNQCGKYVMGKLLSIQH